jgi:hypothetical protein
MCLHLLLHQGRQYGRQYGRRVSWAAVAAVLVGLLLVGCGTSTRASTAGRSTSTPPPSPTPLPTVDPAQVAHACHDQVHPAPLPAPAALVGGLYVGIQASLSNLTYPKVHLPDGTPQKPLLVPYPPQLPSDAPTNPNLSERTAGGYVLVVCNGSTQPHQIQGVVVRLDSVTPYSGLLNEWSFCAAPYTRSGPPNGGGGGCGGGPAEDEYMHAAFAPSAPVGTVVTTTQTPVLRSDRYGPLPWTLPPGQTILIDVGIVPPSAPGFYTFAFGLAIDGVSPIFAPVAPATLLAPVAHEWTGEACKAPAMQSQIPPATNPPTYYLCPAAS